MSNPPYQVPPVRCGPRNDKFEAAARVASSRQHASDCRARVHSEATPVYDLAKDVRDAQNELDRAAEALEQRKRSLAQTVPGFRRSGWE
jgi:hypothetical protein